MNSKTILLVEDSKDDIFLFEHALSALQFSGTMKAVRSVGDAQKYMLGQGRYAGGTLAPVPSIIVCDSALQGERGGEFIQWVKSEPRFQFLPVVLFSGVAAEQVPAMIRQFGVPVHRKHPDFDAWKEEIRKILAYIQ
jgi:CheY-like chemotaxis protein